MSRNGVTLAAMTLASSMILVDQTAVPLASPDAIQALGAGRSSAITRRPPPS